MTSFLSLYPLTSQNTKGVMEIESKLTMPQLCWEREIKYFSTDKYIYTIMGKTDSEEVA